MTQGSEKSGSHRLEPSDWESFPSDSEHRSEYKLVWNIENIIEMLRDGRLRPVATATGRNRRTIELADLTVTLEGTFLAEHVPSDDICRVIEKDG